MKIKFRNINNQYLIKINNLIFINLLTFKNLTNIKNVSKFLNMYILVIKLIKQFGLIK